MDFIKLNETALQSSRQALVQQFDWEAFLVYSIATQNLKAIQSEDIEGTEIDDNIKNIFNDFAEYYRKKNQGERSESELRKMLKTLKKIVVELYYQADTNEKQIISESLSSINKAVGN